MRCETTSSVKECALRARSSDLHVARVVVSLVVDAVVGLTLGLIAHAVVVFVVAILHRIVLYGRYTLYISRGSSVFEIMHAFSLDRERDRYRSPHRIVSPVPEIRSDGLPRLQSWHQTCKS